MRLIGVLKSQQEAHVFQKFCKSYQIDLLLDFSQNQAQTNVQIWVVNEEDTEKAVTFLEKFQSSPDSPEFYISESDSIEEFEQEPIPNSSVAVSQRLPILTWLWIIASVIIYFFQLGQMQELIKNQGSVSLQAVLTPIEQSFFYDVPQGLEDVSAFLKEHRIKQEADLKTLSQEDLQQWEHLKQVSYFHGFLPLFEDSDYKKAFYDKQMPIFEKIKQGEVYRTLTPVFLHGSVLHILFNMLWLYVLMKQIELKIGVIRTLLLMIIIGVISNTIQYLMTGPFFVGVSGIIMGLATFTYARIQKTAWEGYLLSKTVMFFLMIYVLALALVGLGVFIFNLSSHKDITFGIANTAHVVGGITGFVLGYFNIFRRK